MREVRDKPHLDPLPLRNMTSDSAIQTIDFKVYRTLLVGLYHIYIGRWLT